ncbi:hypothetical protein L1999_15280 [Neobacillus drentensis]|uniref:hypothetical protein n=1 Tax=Neobacillus drentensis TaxID=220684 RepID=UPI001F1F465A|nr:hypothetical protein [Neobacillus drentensis]ULT54530.1 hypothetical protein L1999_15280 [Neobacillus drentensis]
MGNFRLHSSLIAKYSHFDELLTVLNELSNNLVLCNYFNVEISLNDTLIIVDAEWEDETSYRTSISYGKTTELIKLAKSMISGIVLNKSNSM